MKRMLKIIGWTLLGSYLFVCVLGRLAYNHLLFFPPESSYKAGEAVKVLTSEAGDQVAVWQQMNPQAEYTILFSHGNGEDLEGFDYIAEMFLKRGFSFVAYDYSGYGLSSGKPSVKNTYRDIETVYTYLTEKQGIDPSKILLMGHSIGSGPSTYLAAKEPVGGLILECAFTSIYRVVTKVPVFLGSPYPNLSRVRKIDCPLLVIHGTEDRVIPFRQGQQLFAHARDPKIFYPVPGTDHNEVLLYPKESYWAAFADFVKKVQEVR